jgi:hypothetical protein
MRKLSFLNSVIVSWVIQIQDVIAFFFKNPFLQIKCAGTIHRKKKVREFPVHSRDVTTKLSLE